jgi:(p)ppGpp synthase/HD superfamily hydrolase
MSKEELKEKLIQFAKQYYDDISHPLAVANKFEELSPEWVVGLFHDILEDTNCKDWDLFMFLAEYGFYKEFLEIAKLTRKNHQTYAEYIDIIKNGDSIAKNVKIADLKHNLSRTETLKPSLKKRYEKALRILLDGENDEIEAKTQN